MDQILSTILFTLGLQTRLHEPPNVLGDKVENRQEIREDKQSIKEKTVEIQ